MTVNPLADPATVHLAEALNQLATVQLELDGERVRRQELEGDFDSILSSMSDALVETDPRGIIARVNDAAVALLDPAGEGVVGVPVATVLEAGVPGAPWQLMDLGPEERRPRETTLRRTDGTRVAVSLSCAVVEDPDGRVRGAMYVARDLTETQRLLSALETAEGRWRLLAEVSARLGEELEPRAALGDVAARFAAFARCDVAVVLVDGTLVEHVVLSHDDMADGPELRALEGHPVPTGTVLARVVEDGGRLLQAPTRALVPLAAKDRRLGALGLFTPEPGQLTEAAVDLAEQVAGRVAVALTSAELRQSVVELRSAQKLARYRDDVVASLSHDMRTPLTVIAGSIEVIQDMGEAMPAETANRLYAGVANQARRLRRLVTQFLDYSRLEAGRTVTVATTATDLAPLVRTVVESFNHADISVEIADGLPPVLADPDRADQCLSNLIGNALKFSPSGEPIKVTAEVAGDEVEVAVADRGPGISPRELATLYQKFSRGSSAEGTEGTGLGLYMTQTLMEAQGGRISVASRVGEGSRFSLHFPLVVKQKMTRGAITAEEDQ